MNHISNCYKIGVILDFYNNSKRIIQLNFIYVSLIHVMYIYDLIKVI